MNRLWTDLSLDGSNYLQSFIISNPLSILVNIKQLKELKKQKKEQDGNKEDDRASTSTTQDVEEVIQEETVQEGREQDEIEGDHASTRQDVKDVKIEPMDIDEDEVITEKLVSGKRILEEQARELPRRTSSVRVQIF